MGILDRISFLIRANVGDLLQRADNPEAEVNQLLADMEAGIVDARRQIAAIILQEKELEDQVEESELIAENWRSQAERAVRAGSDAHALEALRGERDALETASMYNRQLELQRDSISYLRSQLARLNQRYRATEAERDLLLARDRRAATSEVIAESITDSGPLDANSGISALEREVADAESRVDAERIVDESSVDRQFEELDSDAELQEQLRELKRTVGVANTDPAQSGEVSA